MGDEIYKYLEHTVLVLTLVKISEFWEFSEVLIYNLLMS